MLLKELEAIREGVKAIKIDENKREIKQVFTFFNPYYFCLLYEGGMGRNEKGSPLL